LIYPNPTNRTATLQFDNSKKENCTLTIYDLQGRLVMTIINVCSDKIEIERQNLPSGLYFLQIRTESKVIATGKLTIE
jgi:hypothetical protein